MKKTLLLFICLGTSIFSFGQYQGFENWTSASIETLDDYQTGTIESVSLGLNTSYSSTDSYLGSKSIKLETMLSTNGDTLFGYFLSGDPDKMAPGQATGVADVDSVIGYYKSNLQANDSALLLCMTTYLGAQSGGGTFYFKGVQSTWKRFAFSINAANSDSLLVAVAGGDPLNDFSGIPGSWIMVDNIQLKAANGTMAPIVNHSFENWSNISWEQPTGWATANPYVIGQSPMPVVKSTDFYSGSFAAELNTVTNQYGDTIPGIATNGQIGNNGASGGKPYTSTPVAVELYYKYTPSGLDVAYVNFQFRKNGAVLNTYATGLSSASTYTLWTTPISITTPDTVLVTLFAGNNAGSKLKVDAIDFVMSVGETEYLNVEQLVSYPNPVSDLLNIRFNLKADNTVTIRLMDVAGKELAIRSLGNITSGVYNESFNTSEFSSGIYFIEFTLGEEKVVNKFIIK